MDRQIDRLADLSHLGLWVVVVVVIIVVVCVCVCVCISQMALLGILTFIIERIGCSFLGIWDLYLDPAMLLLLLRIWLVHHLYLFIALAFGPSSTYTRKKSRLSSLRVISPSMMPSQYASPR